MHACVHTHAHTHTLLSKVGWGTVEEKAGWHKIVEGTEHQPAEFGLCLMRDGKPREEQEGNSGDRDRVSSSCKGQVGR